MDLSPIAACIRLEKINLNATRVVDFGPLASCTRLRELYAKHAAIPTVLPLTHCTQLERLEIHVCGLHTATDLRPLSRCRKLRWLVLFGPKDKLNIFSDKALRGVLAKTTNVRRFIEFEARG